jgi:hypothetical protein
MRDKVARYDKIDPGVGARVDKLLGSMTLAEKACNLSQAVPEGVASGGATGGDA